MTESFVKELIDNTVNSLRNDIIPISNAHDAKDFERTASKLEMLALLTGNMKVFIQELEAINYWASDSCTWSEAFLDELNAFNRIIKKELKTVRKYKNSKPKRDRKGYLARMALS